MPHSARLFLVLLLLGALSGFAQTTSTATSTAAAAEPAPATSTDEETAGDVERSRTSQEIRQQFSMILRENPPELATILSLDPTLLSNDAFLSGYPELARYVAKHPEVRRNPRFYLGDFVFDNRSSTFEKVFEPLIILLSFGLVFLALGWFVRTLIEQKRWTRLAQTQTEVHSRIMDRFGSSEELLRYIQTPAGSKFLESAPIPLHAEQPAQFVPLNRAILSIQLGIVLAAGAIGTLVVSGKFDPETAQAFFALGVIAFTVGIGFVVSAGASLLLTRRLGLWRVPAEGSLTTES